MNSSVLSFLAPRLAAVLLGLGAAAAFAQGSIEPQVEPPGRVAHVSARQGSLVYAPEGEDEWTELPANRPLTRGDRLWTDRGGRAELHLGTSTVHVESESNLALFALDDDEAQLSLTQGTLNARVRELAPRENFEIDTPNLALRAAQPGDYRVDVDAARGTTRVSVRSGQAIVYGERGESMQLTAGQQAVFAGRALQQVAGAAGGADDFDRWSAERNRAEDESVSARYVPRAVIGYSQLDSHGNWAQDTSYGPVWYPRITVQDWAPYRYGRWTYVRPWGWTWVDDAPWGFAPFHYGRWAFIQGRWGWVPGRFVARPVYAPALVVFVGGGNGVNFNLSIGGSPGIAWYPLAPGETWHPPYRYSPVYLTRVNRNVVALPPGGPIHVHRERAITSVRIDDFHRGRPVREAWRPVRTEEIGRAPVLRELPRPERERHEERRERERAPRLQAAPPSPAATPPVPLVREPLDNRDALRAAREQDRAQREQERARHEAERLQREQASRQQEVLRQQQDALRQQQERSHREQAQRQQDALRQQQEALQQQQALRQQQERQQREQERAAREQERARHEAERQQREQVRPQAAPPRERAAPPQDRVMPPQQPKAREEREEREERRKGPRGEAEEPRRGNGPPSPRP